ncbi:Hypothetical protein CINCED_3A004411 [Cinara cedri]|uniref:Uncharacterized protein n=1 Tax=Cinara cedri TaxID=506608 RepID=A0A5E4MG30_9HEMI|nr:Hypothetical protein CINCED_3A004411 [Cinara cedri]
MMHSHDTYDLRRYALAFIKKSGSANKIQDFLPLVFNSIQAMQKGWGEKHFDELYKQFIHQQARQSRQNNTQNFQTNAGFRANIGQSQNNTCHFQSDAAPQANTGRPQTIRIEHAQVNTHSYFWDCLLLQCWFNSLFGGRSHAASNITNFNYSNGGNNSASYVHKKKESYDGRKLLAAGIALIVVVAIFHISMCYWYGRSREMARKSGKIDYLDNTLKTLRNVEFLGSAASLAGLVACVVYPVLPTWGLVTLGVHSLVCFVGGLAFHMSHERESEYIELAKNAVESYLNPAPSTEFNPNAFSDNNSRPVPSAPGAEFPQAPPPYSTHGQTAFYFGPFSNVDVQGRPQIVKS